MIFRRRIKRCVSLLNGRPTVPVNAIRLHYQSLGVKHEIRLPPPKERFVHRKRQSERGKGIVKNIFNLRHLRGESLLEASMTYFCPHLWTIFAVYSRLVQLLFLGCRVMVRVAADRFADTLLERWVTPLAGRFAGVAAIWRHAASKEIGLSRDGFSAASTWHRPVWFDPIFVVAFGGTKNAVAIARPFACESLATTGTDWVLARWAEFGASRSRRVSRAAGFAVFVSIHAFHYREICDLRQSQVDLGLKRVASETPLGLFA